MGRSVICHAGELRSSKANESVRSDHGHLSLTSGRITADTSVVLYAEGTLVLDNFFIFAPHIEL